MTQLDGIMDPLLDSAKQRCLVRIDGRYGIAVYEPLGARYTGVFGPWERALKNRFFKAARRGECEAFAFDFRAPASAPPSEHVWRFLLRDTEGVEFFPYLVYRSMYLVRCVDVCLPLKGDDIPNLPIALKVATNWFERTDFEVLKRDGWTIEYDMTRTNHEVGAYGRVSLSSFALHPFAPFQGPTERSGAGADCSVAVSDSDFFPQLRAHCAEFRRRLVNAETDTPLAASQFAACESPGITVPRRSYGTSPCVTELGSFRRTMRWVVRWDGVWASAHPWHPTRWYVHIGPWSESRREELERQEGFRPFLDAPRPLLSDEPHAEERGSWACLIESAPSLVFFPTVRHRGRRVHCFPPFYERRADGSWDVGPGKAKFWVVRYIDQDRWRSDAAYVGELRGLEREGWRFDLDEPGVTPAFIEGLIAEGDLEFIPGPPPEGPTGLVETD